MDYAGLHPNLLESGGGGLVMSVVKEESRNNQFPGACLKRVRSEETPLDQQEVKRRSVSSL